MTDIGWYGSAYLLTNCSFQLSFGKLYSFYSVKGVFLASIALFEIGSAICGAAPNSVAFIVGRAIAGLGSAGIFSGGVSLGSCGSWRAFYDGMAGIADENRVLLDHRHSVRRPSPQTPAVPRLVRGGVWDRFCHRTSAGWRFHEQC